MDEQQSWSDDPAYGVFARMVRVQTRLWNEVDSRTRDRVGLPLTDLTALELVAGAPGRRVQDLAATLHITVGGASKVVDRLAASGAVRRLPNPDDRRSSLLSLTAKGRRLLARAKPDIDDVLASRITSVLGATDAADLDRILTRLQDAAEPTTKE